MTQVQMGYLDCQAVRVRKEKWELVDLELMEGQAQMVNQDKKVPTFRYVYTKNDIHVIYKQLPFHICMGNAHDYVNI